MIPAASPIPASLAQLTELARIPAILARWVDTDTLHADLHYPLGLTIRQRAIRLYGVQGPEHRGPTKLHAACMTATAETAWYGAHAVIQPVGRQIDVHGRYLALVWVDLNAQAVCLNAWLVLNGLAVLWRPSRHPGPSRIPGLAMDIPTGQKPSGLTDTPAGPA
jgi:endonuclease YncB( thermonuclease family)